MQVALFGFVGFDIGHSDFLGSFAWGVTVSLNSFSVVFSLDPFPLSGVACLEIRVGAVCRSRTVGFQLRFGSSGDSSLWVGSVCCCFFFFLGLFAWGATVSSDSFSLVFSLCHLRLCGV